MVALALTMASALASRSREVAVGDSAAASEAQIDSLRNSEAVTTTLENRGPATSLTIVPTTAAQTTTLPTTTSSTTTTAVPLRIVQLDVGSEVYEVALSPNGWVIPEVEDSRGTPLGARSEALHPFVPPNNGPFGVNIDDAFFAENEGAPWLYYEDGTPVIDGVAAVDQCLNIMVPMILRGSFISCPTRVQNNDWGYAGEVDDAPAVNIAQTMADGVVIEHNTITCSGFDEDICGRSIRIGSPGAIVRFNDLSNARGAVELFHDATFVFNYLHDFSFGFDPTRAHSETDRVTHNNSVNNLGYRNVTVAGNYIDATYGRVSLEPELYRNPHFHKAFPEGIVDEGDPINGFAFTSYLVNGDGLGGVYTRNYVRGVGRPFRCNSSALNEASVCADDISFNVFDNLQIGLFNSVPPFEDEDGQGSLGGSCNFELIAGQLHALALPGEADDLNCDQGLPLSQAQHRGFTTQLIGTGASSP